MIRANITKDGLVSPADKFTESILAQERTALLRAQTKLPDAIILNDILPDFLAKRALQLLIFCRRGLININFPACAAGMPALICLAAKIIVKIRIYCH
jgi:hypothetical protein